MITIPTNVFLIEIIKPLAYMPIDMYIQEAKLGENNRFYISKGARGAASISIKNVKILASGVSFISWLEPENHKKPKLPVNKIIHLSIGKTDFTCPYCNKQYDDIDSKYLNRIQKQMDKKSPRGYINVKCICKQTFGLSFNFKGHLVSFKI